MYSLRDCQIPRDGHKKSQYYVILFLPTETLYNILPNMKDNVDTSYHCIYFISTCIWQHLCIYLPHVQNALTYLWRSPVAFLALVLACEGITTRGNVAGRGIETMDFGIQNLYSFHSYHKTVTVICWEQYLECKRYSIIFFLI